MSDWDEVFTDAIVAWGEEAQWRQLQEECGELIAAVNRAQRGRPDALRALMDEVADVTIMVQQARQMLGADLVDRAIAAKVARLKLRVEHAKQGGSGPVGG
jgi:NTP pyrophosphatase (non-canonical NTP hydrolase)